MFLSKIKSSSMKTSDKSFPSQINFSSVCFCFEIVPLWRFVRLLVSTYRFVHILFSLSLLYLFLWIQPYLTREIGGFSVQVPFVSFAFVLGKHDCVFCSHQHTHNSRMQLHFFITSFSSPIHSVSTSSFLIYQ